MLFRNRSLAWYRCITLNDVDVLTWTATLSLSTEGNPGVTMSDKHRMLVEKMFADSLDPIHTLFIHVFL